MLKTKEHIVLLLPIVYCLLSTAFAQSVSPTLISATGNYSQMVSAPKWYISSSVGEPMVKTTPLVGGIQLTQGFQQSQQCSIAISSISAGSGNNFAICKGESVTLNVNATATGTSSPLMYSWSPSPSLNNPIISNPVATPTVITTYTVNVSALSCTSATRTITIAVNLTPTVTISSTSVTCNGGADGSAAVTAAGGTPEYTYLWNTGGQTTSTATGLTAGNYTVMVTDANGCASTNTANITQPSPLTVTVTSASANTICRGETITLTATTSGGLAPYTYKWQWATGNSTSNPLIVTPPLGTPTYMITATDSYGCKGIKTVTVTVKQTPPAPTPSATPNPICSWQTLSLSADNSGSSYSWNGPNNYTSTNQNPTIQNISTAYSGHYSVTVTSAAGCTSPAGIISVTVNPTPTPAITYTGTTTFCQGGNVILGTVTSYTDYSWSTIPIQTTQTITVTTAGTYIVTVWDDGCKGSAAPVTVTVNPKPSVSISISTTICTGMFNNTTLTATTSGGVSYLWLPVGGTTSSIVVGNLSTGIATYTVEVKDTKNCKGMNTISINVKPNPYARPVVTPADSSYCLGDSIVPLRVTNPDTSPAFVIWKKIDTALFYFGNPYPPPQTLSVGAHSGYVAQGVSGCFSDPAQVSVTINPLPVVSISDSTTICPGSTAQLSVSPAGNTYTYEWFYNSWDSLIPNSNSANISVNPDSTSIYIAGIFDKNGCWDKDTVKVIVNLSPTSDCENICDSIYNGITPNGDGYNDAWWIDGIRSFPRNHVFIFNRWGGRVWHHKQYDNDDVIWRGTNENGEKLPSGTYFYVIEIEHDRKTITCSGWIEVTH